MKTAQLVFVLGVMTAVRLVFVRVLGSRQLYSLCLYVYWGHDSCTACVCTCTGLTTAAQLVFVSVLGSRQLYSLCLDLVLER